MFDKRKNRIALYMYLALTIPVFMWNFLVIRQFDSLYETGGIHFFHAMKGQQIPMYVCILLFLTYCVIAIYWIIVLVQRRRTKIRYERFHNYSDEEQKQYLTNQFCKTCLTQRNLIFVNEYVIEGMKWIKGSCRECESEVKVRIN